MDHLTIDDIIAFVSLTELNQEALDLSAAVTGHIRQCKHCLELVHAFQTVYDEFSTMSIQGTFKKYIQERALNTGEKVDPIEDAEELEGYM